MAHKKIGLSYFPMDTDWEFKIKVFKAKFNLKGTGFVTELWKAAYKDDGYYLKLGQDEKILFCSENGLTEKEFDELLVFAFEKEIFNKNLYDKFQILTSTGIQKRYIEGSKKRCAIKFEKKYLLIDPEIPQRSKLKIEIVDINDSGLPTPIGTSGQAGADSGHSEPELKLFETESGDSGGSGLQMKEKEMKEKEKDNSSVSNSLPVIQEPEINFIDQLLNIFLEEYEINRGMSFETLNPGVERRAIGKLLKAYKIKNKSSPKTQQQTIEDFRRYFKACLKITDNWLRENMSPGLIVNKFNEIKTILKRRDNNGGGNNTKPGATVEGIFNAVNRAVNMLGSS
jgi:hypothetical protein